MEGEEAVEAAPPSDRAMMEMLGDNNRLVSIAEKGIAPLVALLGAGNARARENAAGKK